MAKIKIQADTKEVTKSVMDLAKQVKAISKQTSPITLIGKKEQAFIKKDLNQELSKMKKELKSNRSEFTKLVKEGKKLAKGSQDELENRKKITKVLKEQRDIVTKMGSMSGGTGR